MFACSFSPTYEKRHTYTKTETKISLFSTHEGNKQLTAPFKALKNLLLLKISLNVMGADLHNVMVTHAVSFSEQKVLFFPN